MNKKGEGSRKKENGDGWTGKSRGMPASAVEALPLPPQRKKKKRRKPEVEKCHQQ
jgi:hypothetical protein